MTVETDEDARRIEELRGIIQAVRDRVSARYPEPDNTPADGAGEGRRIRVPVADLMPLVHARDAAQAKIAAIGSVNPRAGGFLNNSIQLLKKAVARALQWFVRDQIAFNRETVSAIEALIEALNEQNRALVSLAAQANEQNGHAWSELRRLEPELRELKDIRAHWIQFRADWERKVTANEIQFLRSVADLQGAFQHRTTLMESNFREIVNSQHSNYLGALDRATVDIQKQLWSDMQKVRAEYDRLIQTELRLIRQRASAAATGVTGSAVPESPAAAAPASANFDYARFAERFRGAEDYVRSHVEFYRPFFEGLENVLDIGCGRGEFLAMLRDLGVHARGIDTSAEAVLQSRQKGLEAEVADLFTYLPAQMEGDFDGIFSSQVVEHLDPATLPEMVRLCASRLRRGGLLVIETPNPECLAIFATHFYLDPTHTRPIPHPLLAFYMEEAGLGQIEVHKLSPAVETMPEIAELPEHFRARFFGGLDYAIAGRKL